MREPARAAAGPGAGALAGMAAIQRLQLDMAATLADIVPYWTKPLHLRAFMRALDRLLGVAPG